MSYLRYGIIGTDRVFSFAPVDIGDNNFILCDGLYDLADLPYNDEFCRIALPRLFLQYKLDGWAEYWNPVTGLLIEYRPEEEGYSPESYRADSAPKKTLETNCPVVSSCAGGGFSLDRVIEFVGFNRPAVLVTDCEMYWSANTLNDILTWDDCQNRAFKLVEIDINEAKEFFEV